MEPTLDFTTRLAKIVARKSQLPTYVGNSISFANTGLGGTVEEEMGAFGSVAELVIAKLQLLASHAHAVSDGVVL